MSLTKIAILLTLIIYCNNSVFSLYNQKLSFDKETKTFNIMQVTDIHYGETEENDSNTDFLMRNILKSYKPDMIALTGDALSGYAWDGKNTTFYHDKWKQWSSAFEETETPYAYTTGNHDTQADLEINEIMNLDTTNEFAIFRENYHSDFPKDIKFEYPVSLSNYFIRIYSSDYDKNSDNNKVKMILWFVDSGNDGCEDVKAEITWGCITSSQIEWFEINSKLIEKELAYLPSGFVFYHIPTPEFRLAYNYRESYGYRGDEVNCPNKETHFFDSIKRIGNIKALFVGHDHNNDYCALFYGVELCYGRKTGYGSYGPSYFQRGMRIIKLKEIDDEVIVNNWDDNIPLNINLGFEYTQEIIQEDLTIVDSSTYNRSFKGMNDYLESCQKI